MMAITDPNANQQYVKEFIENFDANIKFLCKSYQDLADWLNKREQGMAFVGI